MAICLVGAAVMSYGMYTFLHLFPHYPASAYAWILIGVSVLAVFGYLMPAWGGQLCSRAGR